jgi:CRP-like cAMP-binding protein
MRPISLRLNLPGNDAPLLKMIHSSPPEKPFNSYVILSGTVRAVGISTGERAVFVRYGAGYFTGDIDLFTRRPSIISVEAETSIEAVRLTPK